MAARSWDKRGRKGYRNRGTGVAMDNFMPGEGVVARIKGDIAAYEAERRQVRRAMLWRVPAFLGAVLFVVAAIALMFNILADPYEQWLSAPHLFLYAIGLLALYFAYRQAMKPARRLTQSFRERVLSSVFGFIDQLRYKHGERPQTFERLPQEVTGKFKLPIFGDMISGRYDGFGFEFYETTLARSSRRKSAPAFKGVVVAFGAVSPFPGLLIASPRASGVLGFVRKLFGAKIDGLRSGIDRLDARYSFMTDNVAVGASAGDGTAGAGAAMADRSLARQARARGAEPRELLSAGPVSQRLLPASTHLAPARLQQTYRADDCRSWRFVGHSLAGAQDQRGGRGAA